MTKTPPLQGIFITGTGTDVGKTVVTGALYRALALRATPTLVVKPVQTGTIHDAPMYCSAAQHLSHTLPPRTLHTFNLPASPHFAAAQAGKSISVAHIVDGIHSIHNSAHTRPLLIEGAGGLCVPLNGTETMLDLMAALKLPIVIVIHNTLGALNHALLTIDTAQHRGLSILALVMNEGKISSNTATTHKHNTEIESLIAQDNCVYLAKRFPHIPQYILRFNTDIGAGMHNEQECMPSVSPWHSSATLLAELAQQCQDLWKTPIDSKNKCLSSENPCLTWDKQHLWHPYTSATHPLPVYEVTRTEGKYIFLKGGEKLLDGMASWWCAIHGYGHPRLVAAAHAQAASFSHVMFGGLTHAPAVIAAQKLLALLPPALTRLFWADSGSVAVEVALKMALQYQYAVGEKQRTRFLTPYGGYYGDTQGAMSLCDPINGMHTLFANTLQKPVLVPRPQPAFAVSAQHEARFAAPDCAPLDEAFAQHGHELAACIIEPIVQGAGGMYFYHPEYLTALRALCSRHGVLLICDEIATGFGRTGKMFASEWALIAPDICCVGKALTGGFMNLAATICTEAVAEGICRDNHVFMHGPTFMANPLACAVAAASMDVLTQSPWQRNVAAIERALRCELAICKNIEIVKEVRVLGAIGVVELRQALSAQAVATLQAYFVKQGVWIRPFGRLLYVMPPYICDAHDIALLAAAIHGALQENIFHQ